METVWAKFIRLNRTSIDIIHLCYTQCCNKLHLYIWVFNISMLYCKLVTSNEWAYSVIIIIKQEYNYPWANYWCTTQFINGGSYLECIVTFLPILNSMHSIRKTWSRHGIPGWHGFYCIIWCKVKNRIRVIYRSELCVAEVRKSMKVECHLIERPGSWVENVVLWCVYGIHWSNPVHIEDKPLN